MPEIVALRSIPLTTTNEAQQRKRTTPLFVNQAAVGDRSQLNENVIIADPVQTAHRSTPTPTAAPMPSILDREGLPVVGERKVSPIAWIPQIRPAEDKFALLQQWEGVVQALNGDEFTVVLRDLTNPNNPEEVAVLPLEEITGDDLRLLRPGAILYWSIGYRTHRTGQVDRVSTIRLRRLPAWSRLDLQRRDARAKSLMERFGVDSATDRDSGTR